MELLSQLKTELSKDLKVLVVDDEPQILSALRRELRGQDFEVLCIGDPFDALEAVHNQEFAVILSDNMMPGMTGLEFLAKAKTIAPATKRILLTGKTDQTAAIDAFNQGVIHRFLDKPWSKEHLLAILKEDLDNYLVGKMEKRLDQLKTQTIQRRTDELEAMRRELAEARTELGLEKDGQKTLVMPGPLAQLRYLIVDPHQGTAEGLQKILKASGVKQVDVATNGLEGLQKATAEDSAYDVVLSEWELGKISGLTLLKALRERTELPVQPFFIFITSLVNRASVEYAHVAHADGYLLKPFELERLIQQLSLLTAETGRPRRTVHSLKHLTVLVANKEAGKRLFIQKCLGDVEVKKYVLADSGNKALKLLIHEKIDVILYDATITDPSWEQLQGKLANIGADHGQPMVITGYDPPEPKLPVGSEKTLPPDAKPQLFLPPGFSQEDFNRALLAALEKLSGDKG
ncbi:MAG: response regulator [bacterium]|nr:response regulator [bacterium]